ncbi:MAG: hypothetical protein AB7I13_08135, partial [Vicinamibacterales bacterium]
MGRTWTARILCENPILEQSLTRALQRRGHHALLQPRGPDADPARPDPASSGQTDALIAVAVGPGAGGSPDERQPYAVMADGIRDAAARGVRTIVIRPRTARGAHRSETDPAPPASLVIRTTPVYGIGDDPITSFFVAMRTLPAVPVLTDRWVAQPLWHEDLAAAAAAALTAVDRSRTVLDVAGPEAVTHQDLYDRLSALIGRRPLRMPLPGPLVDAALAVPGARAVAPWLEAFDEPDALVPIEANALATPLDVVPTPLAHGLTRLARELPEQTPGVGVGSVEAKRFSAVIRGSRYQAAELLRRFRARFAEVMPIDVGIEPVAPERSLAPGATLTLALPGRGHVQVRVEEATDRHVVIAALRGHAIAGFVRFRARDVDDAVLFDVFTCDSAGSPVDWLMLSLGSSRLQDAHWATVVSNVVRLSEGAGTPVESDGR